MRLRQLRGWLARASGFFNHNADREFDEELECHLQMHIEDNLRAGLDPQEARRQALIKLGGVAQTRENYRRQRGLPLMEILIKDLRYGLRMLARRPGVTLIAVLSLALGIGANTAIFSLVNTIMLRPLPVAAPERIVSLRNETAGRVSMAFSYPNYKDFRDRNDVFDGLIGYRFAPLSVSHDGINEKLWGYVVTGNYFETLGVGTALGRAISADDDRLAGAHPVTVLSYKCWQQRFGADQAIIGKNIIVNGRSFVVIGVAPQGFFGTEFIAAPDMWFPMAMQGEIEMGSPWLDRRDMEQTYVQGRLKSGVSLAQAQAAMESIALQLEREFPQVNEGKRVSIAPPGLMDDRTRGSVLGFAGILMSVVAFALLLACTNLANLLLARAVERRKEIAVRLSLGASRGRVVLQLMAESMLLAAGGGLIGLMLAFWLVRLAVGIKLPIDFPLQIDLHLDYRVLLFTCLVSLATGVLFGLLPALQTTKVDLITALKDERSYGVSRRSWLKSGLIVFQVALSLVLLVGGGLMLRALGRAQAINLGFDPHGVIEVSFDLRLQGYDNARGREFQKLLLDRVRSLPGVESAGLIDLTPVDLHFGRSPVFIEGQTPERIINAPRAMTSRISPGYLDAMRTRLIEGRDFSERDDENAPRVALVNRAFARRFWPGENPLGRRFSQGSPQSPLMEVIGVIEDGMYAGLSDDAQPYFCRPMLQAYSGSTTMVARASDPQKTLAAIRNETQQLDPRMPVTSRLLIEKMSMPLLPARVAASVLGGFGLLALALAAIGIYGVMSQAVARRTHEIGVRMALGAQASDVLKLTMRQGTVLTMVGVATGLSAALALTQLMKRLLFGVSATDPATYVIVAALLVAVALLACYLPAWRATKIDPIRALRYE
ncbi:MAG: ABC transporter permease [Acidobacteriota bacterium]